MLTANLQDVVRGQGNKFTFLELELWADIGGRLGD